MDRRQGGWGWGMDDVLPKTTRAVATTQEQNPGVWQTETMGFTETQSQVSWRQASTGWGLRLDSEGTGSPDEFPDCNTPIVTSQYHQERVFPLSGTRTPTFSVS